MRVKWKEDTEVEILDGFDENDNALETVPKIFKKGTISEFEIFDRPSRMKNNELVECDDLVNVHFKDGKFGMVISEEWYDVIG